MRKPLFIGIGVHKPKYMETLPGVLNAIDEMSAWAAKTYDVLTIDDRTTPVTIKQIRSVLTPDDDDNVPDPALLLNRPRIIVYFCGHGIAAWPDQYWILSPGPNQTRERISANAFRDTLATYEPKQIAFISDACRSSAHLVGAGDPVLDRLEGAVKNPQKDIFYSCQDGQSSFAVPGSKGKRAYLIFSSILQRALSKPDGSNLDPVLLQLNRRVVTSQSLSNYLEEHVPAAALKVDRIQTTQCDPGFRPFNHIYEEFPIAHAADQTVGPALDAKPGMVGAEHDDLAAMARFVRKQFKFAESARRRRLQGERFNLSRSEWRAPLIKTIQRELGKITSNPSLAIVGSHGPTFIESDDDWIPFRYRVTADIQGRQSDVFWTDGPWLMRYGETVLLRYGHQSLSLIPTFPDMHGVCVTNDYRNDLQGLEFLSWISVHGDFDDDKLLHSAEALKGLSRGFLNSGDATKLAGQIRYVKHLDPMMGVVAAYLYNAAGDIDNIRRMAFYYTQHGQPIPFDIAMLGGLRLELSLNGFYTNVPPVKKHVAPDDDAPNFTRKATPAASGPVAGVVPILRAGWPYLRNSPHRLHRSCWELIDHLAPSPVTAFVGEHAVSAISAAFRGD